MINMGLSISSKTLLFYYLAPLQNDTVAEIVETTLVISRFRFLRVGSRISELREIILPGMQIFKVGSRISTAVGFIS